MPQSQKQFWWRPQDFWHSETSLFKSNLRYLINRARTVLSNRCRGEFASPQVRAFACYSQNTTATTYFWTSLHTLQKLVKKIKNSKNSKFRWLFIQKEKLPIFVKKVKFLWILVETLEAKTFVPASVICSLHKGCRIQIAEKNGSPPTTLLLFCE